MIVEISIKTIIFLLYSTNDLSIVNLDSSTLLDFSLLNIPLSLETIYLSISSTLLAPFKVT